jgi:hypothetical protein
LDYRGTNSFTHNRNFARNIELLRKSREDSRIDAALRQLANRPDDSLDHEIDDIDPANLEPDDEESYAPMDEGFSAETLIASYHSIAKSWDAEKLTTGRRIPTLLSGPTCTRSLELDCLQPLDVFGLPTYATSGLKIFPATTLECWNNRVKRFCNAWGHW